MVPETSEESGGTRIATDTAGIRELLAPGVSPRQSAAGYLDLLPEEQPSQPDTRSQSLWESNPGPKIYLKLVQPVVRAMGAPPNAETLAVGLRLETGGRVLDVGCGPGVITAGLATAVGPEGVAVGLDLSAAMLTTAAASSGSNLGFLRGNAMQLPFPDGTFDAVCATAMIMLVPDPAAAMREMARVLAPGGWLAVVVPCRGTGLSGLLGASVGRIAGGRMFGPDEIPEMLDSLDVDRVFSNHNDLISTTYARRSVGSGGANSKPGVADV